MGITELKEKKKDKYEKEKEKINAGRRKVEMVKKKEGKNTRTIK